MVINHLWLIQSVCLFWTVYWTGKIFHKGFIGIYIYVYIWKDLEINKMFIRILKSIICIPHHTNGTLASVAPSSAGRRTVFRQEYSRPTLPAVHHTRSTWSKLGGSTPGNKITLQCHLLSGIRTNENSSADVNTDRKTIDVAILAYLFTDLWGLYRHPSITNRLAAPHTVQRLPIVLKSNSCKRIIFTF